MKITCSAPEIQILIIKPEDAITTSSDGNVNLSFDPFLN